MMNRRIFAIQASLGSVALAVASKEVIAAAHAGAPMSPAAATAASAAKPAKAASAAKASDAPAKSASGAANMVNEKDANAVGLGYKADTTTVDKSKNPAHVAGSKCSGCALFQGKAGDSAGACPLFAGKQVAANGWCTAFAKKA